MVFTITGWGQIKSVLNGHNIEHRHDPMLGQAKVNSVPYEKCYEMWHGVELPEDFAKMSKFQAMCFFKIN